MFAKLICQVMGHDLERQWYGFGYDEATRVFSWITRLACNRCAWNDVRKLGAPAP
jgi:hypothetical protein